MATISLIIPAWNCSARLRRTLRCVEEQTQRPDQVIVVDNASTDETPHMVAREFPWVELVRLPRNTGTAGGVNAGLRRARGDLIATLDSDAYPHPTWMQRFVEGLLSHEQFSFAACRLLLAATPHLIDSAGDTFDPLIGGEMRGHGEADGPRFREPREVFTATGAASLYRREVFEDVGFLDERLFIYSDDIDLGFRARLRGFRCLYVPEAVALHERSATLGRGSPLQTRLVYRNRVVVYVKNMPWPLVRPRLARVVRTWLAALVHAPYPRAALRGYVEAMGMLPYSLRQRRTIQGRRVVDPDTLLASMAPDGLPLG